MPLLKNPNELSDNITPAILIYGQPGIGKSTLALSGPDPVAIDFDRGMYRVLKRFQKPTLVPEKWEEVLELFKGSELDPFASIAFDTLGRLIDLISIYLGRINPKNIQGNGALTQQGWGALKSEFQSLLKIAKSKNKILVFIAHEKEEKDSDTRLIRPDTGGGASGKDLVKDLDAMGYMEMRAGKHTISFTPSDKFYAKNSLRLDPIIEVPNPEVHGNTFIQKYIIEKTVERLKEDAIENAKYDALLANIDGFISTVNNAKTADEALATILMAPVIWDSQRVAKHRLNEKTKAINVIYDKDKKTFVDPLPAPVAAIVATVSGAAVKPEMPAFSPPQPSQAQPSLPLSNKQVEEEFERVRSLNLTNQTAA